MLCLIARLLAAVLLVASAAASAQTADDPLAQLNTTARAAYGDGRTALIGRTSPVIIVAFDELTLLRDGKETTERFTPNAYHQLKTVAHVPLGTVTLLAAQVPGAREGAWRQRLTELRDRARDADGAIDKTALTARQKLRQHRIIADSVQFIEQALERGVPAAAELNTFARGLGPLLLANAREAAAAQIDALHALTQRWRGEMGDEEWRRLMVVVLGGKLPRAGNLQYEYFAAALGPGSADRRVVYAEGIFDRKSAMNLLATIVTDRRVGEAFFAEEARMERDLLADGAKDHLLRLFGKLGSD